MAKNVSNEGVLAALRGLGLNVTGPVSMTGAQNSEWKRKILPLLTQQFGSGAENVFNRAIDVAKKIKDIPASAQGTARLAATLRAYGTDEKTMVKITNEARRVQKTTPGYRAGNKEFGDNDFAQAAANVLGHTGAVLDAFSNAGIKQPPAPAPGTAGAKVTPAPGAGEFAPNTPGIDPYIYRGELHPAPAPGAQPPAQKPGGGPGPGGPGAPGGGGVVDKGLPKNATDAQVEEYFRKNYGAEAWMLAIPDFKDIIRQVATNPSGWTVSSIVSAVQAKPWWQQNGQDVADFLKTKANDTVGFKKALGSKTQAIQNAMAQYGITLPPERIEALGEQSYKWNWDQDQINKAVADEFDYRQGQHSVFVDKLNNDAKKYLVPLSEGTINAWGDRLITGGEAENGNWAQFLKEQAKSMFPGFATRLDGNETMEDITKPYAAIASSTLEMPEGEINFMDPKWMKALDTTDDKGNHTYMSPADWARHIKTDPIYRYDFTEGAKQAATGMATNLLKTFGAM